MRSFLIIGMGRFGRELAWDLSNRGHDVMIVDRDEDTINALSPHFPNAFIGDCTNEDVLRSLGVNNFDAIVVAMGGDFQSSLEITALAKDLGGRYVISKANRDIQAKFLLRNGADKVVYPDRDMAARLSVQLHAKNIFDYVELAQGYAIMEFSVPRSWVGMSLRQNDLRRRHGVNILAIRSGGKMDPLPDPEYVFQSEDHVYVMGKEEVLLKLTKQ